METVTRPLHPARPAAWVCVWTAAVTSAARAVWAALVACAPVTVSTHSVPWLPALPTTVLSVRNQSRPMPCLDHVSLFTSLFLSVTVRVLISYSLFCHVDHSVLTLSFTQLPLPCPQVTWACYVSCFIQRNASVWEKRCRCHFGQVDGDTAETDGPNGSPPHPNVPSSFTSVCIDWVTICFWVDC